MAMPIAALRMRNPSSGGGATDPNFANVVALLHFDGANGGTTFTDVKGKTWTPSGGAVTSTSFSKFGTASLSLDGSGDYLTGPTSADFAFGAGDFTVEGWCRMSNRVTEIDPLFSISDGSGTTSGFALFARHTSSPGRMRYFNTATGAGTNGTTVLADDTFYHVALSRTGTTLKGFVDGNEEFSITDSTNFGDQLTALIGGSRGASPAQTYFGWIDDFRITKGVGRYTAAFTPPTAAFPDS